MKKKLKIALIGDGKTGQHVVGALKNADHQLIGPFNLTHRLEDHRSEFQQCDVAIVFVPGEAAKELIPLLVDLARPIVLGSTGIDIASELTQKKLELKAPWVYASNFSLGMSLVAGLLQHIKDHLAVLNHPTLSIHEIHHLHKKDAPSGTALTWKRWLGDDHGLSITSAREGDVVGVHELTIKTATEEITLKHQALDRGLFAEGAVVAAELIVNENKHQLFKFENIIDQRTK